MKVRQQWCGCAAKAYAMEEDCEKLSGSQIAVPHAIAIISDDPNDQHRKRWPTHTVSGRIYIYIYSTYTYIYISQKRGPSPETNFETAETRRDIKPYISFLERKSQIAHKNLSLRTIRMILCIVGTS